MKRRHLLNAILATGAGLAVAGRGTAARLPTAADAAARVQQERLTKYAFVRTAYDPQAIGLLLGNAEFGGLAAVSGLAIPQLWGAALWQDENSRRPVASPTLAGEEFEQAGAPSEYRQELGLRDAVLRTRALYAAGNGYEAELFCSLAQPPLIVLRVKNLGRARRWRLQRPAVNYHVTCPAPGRLVGESAPPGYTRCAWALSASKAWETDAAGRETISLAPDESVTLTCAWTTHWSGADYAARCARIAAAAGTDYAPLLAAHRAAWAALWRQAAVLALPDSALEQLWYRALFWTLCTCGSERFLPGESMFAVDCWRMHAFTYGAAGWGVQACAAAGFPDRARAMLREHFHPDALRENAEFYTRRLTGHAAAAGALAFAHEVKPDGRRIPCEPWELQRHLDGFAATLFYRFNRFYPDDRFYREAVYPVLRGTAQFWRGLAQPDAASGQYLLPSMTSLTEDLVATNVIDAALAAKWCLRQAGRAAAELGRDAELRPAWEDLADKLCIPQTPERYLEYFGDREQRPGGGYQGVRGFVYLSYPTVELIPTLDRAKVVRTLDYTWIRNRYGAGMIGFVANWFALADTHLGRSEHALTILQHNLKCLDRWGTSLTEVPGNPQYYFTTGYTSYLLVPLSMAVQSYDDRIAVFPAVPAAWKDFACYNVPAESGVRVSGELRGGAVRWLAFQRDGRELLRLDHQAAVRIRRAGDAVRLNAE